MNYESFNTRVCSKMICQLFSSYACSNDDDDDGGGDVTMMIILILNQKINRTKIVLTHRKKDKICSYFNYLYKTRRELASCTGEVIVNLGKNSSSC